MIAWLKVYLVLAAGMVVLIAAVVIPIAVCDSQPGSRKSSQTAFNTEQGPQSAFRQLSRTPNGGVLLEAVNFLVSRKMEDRLPGIASEAHVGIDFPWLFRDTNEGRWDFIKTNLDSYPIRLTFTVHANQTSERYRYTVAKTSSTNHWQLEQAWLSDTNGRVLKQFSIY